MNRQTADNYLFVDEVDGVILGFNPASLRSSIIIDIGKAFYGYD